MGLKIKPPVGTKVRLTGVFLKNTGQQVGDEGQKRWTTVECKCGLCAMPNFVAVDEPHIARTDPKGYEDVPPEMRAKMWCHIAVGNLQIIGAKLGGVKRDPYPFVIFDGPGGECHFLGDVACNTDERVRNHWGGFLPTAERSK